MRRVAVIVGSGALDLGPTIELAADPRGRNTSYGEASATPLFVEFPGIELYVLGRHGAGHRFAPHQINYRANLRLLADRGVTEVVAINTVGGIAQAARNGTLVIPHQLIDYSWGRAHTFATEENLQHMDFSNPYDESLRKSLLDTAVQCGLVVVDGGVYGCTQGPRLETAAEIVRMERDGATLVGMTGMPEASLARELGMAYASVCLVVNPAAGKSASIDLAGVTKIANEGMRQVSRLLTAFLEVLEQ